MTAILVVLACAATFRSAWLIVHDEIAEPLRRAARWADRRRLGDPEPGELQPLTYLVGCPWCVSIYTGTIVATVTVLWPDNRIILIGLLALTGSAVAGVVAVVMERVRQPPAQLQIGSDETWTVSGDLADQDVGQFVRDHTQRGTVGVPDPPSDTGPVDPDRDATGDDRGGTTPPRVVGEP